MQLLVDVGNSRIKWAFLDGETLYKEQVASHRGVNFDRFLHQIWRDIEAPSRVWVANVAGIESQDALRSWIGTIWHQEPIFLETQTFGFGVTNGYQNQRTLGLDRWLGLVAAFNEFHQEQSVCIIDCGTSLTIDVVNRCGTHLGGLLLPGVDTMRQALSNFTDGCTIKTQEDGVTLPCDTLLARNTEEGMVGGTVFAAVAYIERFLNEIENELSQKLKVLITGGEAPLLLKLVETKMLYRPHLVLEGMIHYAKQASHYDACNMSGYRSREESQNSIKYGCES